MESTTLAIIIAILIFVLLWIYFPRLLILGIVLLAIYLLYVFTDGFRGFGGR